MTEGHTFTARLWRHPGPAAWHFVTLPADVADDLRVLAAGSHRPFGSLPVRARVGEVAWATSLFSDTASGSYLLPVKADVRRRAALADGDQAELTVVLAI